MAEEFNEFIESESARMNEERKEAVKAKGYGEIIKASVGENHFEFVKEVPREGTGILAGKKIFKVIVNGKQYDYVVNPRSSQYRDILTNLRQGKTKLRLIRTGTGKTDTRYTVIAE